jgi:hypothetical protein
MFEGTINIFDIIAAIILIAIIILVSNFYKNSKLEKHPEYKYFTWGVITKIIGAVALVFVYVFYYGGGDTQNYFIGAKVLTNTLFTEPINFFRLLFVDNNEIPTDLIHITKQISYSRATEEWFMVRITSVINIFGFNRYLLSSILISLIAFWGAWNMFKSFIIFFPKHHKAAFISIFLLPSVIFWSSGILKDTITFAALGIFFYHFVKIFIQNKISLISLITITVSAIIIYKLKAYIILGFMPGIFIALFINYKTKITNNIIRKVSSPILFIIIISIGYILVVNMLNDSNKYKIDTLENRVEGFHSWHTTTGGSSYNLGDVEYTTTGIISKIPAALNVTFFRPYLWEARNITSLMGAIESFTLLILFIIVLWKNKLKWIIDSFKNSFLALAFIYSIVFGFAVGFTSYNFGALARYKVPVMPFFVFLLLYYYYKNKTKAQEQN